MCTCVCTHARTHARFALTLGIKEKAPSLVLFSFVYLTPFLPSTGCFCLGRLQRAHCILAIGSDIFIPGTTKDVACPPALPPAVRAPQRCSTRSCPDRPWPPPLPTLRGGTLRPRATGACPPARASLPLPHQEERCCPPRNPGLSPFSSDSCFFQEGMPRNLPPFSPFLQGLPEPPERCCGTMPSLGSGWHRCCFFPWDPPRPVLARGPGQRGEITSSEGCGAERHRSLGPVRKEKALSHWVTRQQLLFQ